MAEIVKKGEPLAEDLAVLQPEANFIEVDGEKVYAEPFKFRSLLKAFKHISVIFSSLQEAGTVEEQIIKALSLHGDDVIGLISLSTGKPVEFFDTLDSVKGLDLAIMTYKVNESFFVQHLIPKLQELLQSDLQEEMPEDPVETKKPKSKKTGSTSSKS